MKLYSLIFTVLLSLFIPVLAYAQQGGETVGIPWRGENGITVSISEMIALEKATASTKPAGIKPRKEEFEFERDDLEENPMAPNVSSWPILSDEEKRNAVTGMLAPQTVGLSFLGMESSESPYIPPDIMGDVGPTQILVHVNGVIKVFNKSGTLGSLNVTDNTFWNSVRNGQDVSDPHIRFDPITGRWFLVIINLPASGANRILIAVSSGSTITNTSSFKFYQFQQDAVGTPGADAGMFADYPTLGVDKNALYIGANMFDPVTYDFIGSSAFVVRKSSLLNDTLIVTPFRQLTDGNTTGPYTPQGVQCSDTSISEGYFVGVDAVAYSKLILRRISNPGGTPSISGNIELTVLTTASPILQVVKGSASNRRLDGLDDRLLAAEIRKNKLTGTISLWTAHTIQVNSSGGGSSSGGRNGSRWYEITNFGSTPTLRQSGTLYSSLSSNPIGYWMPSVAMSGQGHMAIGASYASTNDYASIAVAGRYGTDALGTTQSPTNAVVSSTAYNAEANDAQRWGDYTQTVVDPTDDMTLWTFQEYCNSTNSWALRVLKLVAPPPATPSSASPSTVNTGATNVNVTITGTSSSGSGFFDPGAGFANRISATVNGGGVTVNSITFNGATGITLNLTVSGGAASGARTITVTNPDGQTATSASGILTINNASCPTISLLPTDLPGATLNNSYSQAITASGGTLPYTYSLSAGTLPNGVTLSSGGSLSGTPTQAGTYVITITATDSNACTGSFTDTLFVTGCPTITLSPSSLPNGSSGNTYSQTLSSSGGTSPYTYAVTSGSLPSGLSLSSAGDITGTPSGTGTSSFTVTATDASNCTGTQAYSIQVINGNIISLTTSGVAYTQDFNTLASSGTSSTLPSGWQFKETGTSSNSTYTASTGSGTTGDTYSFGAASNSDRAIGGIQSGNLVPTWGAGFTNNTGATITSLDITYTGEEWRLGATGGRKDTLKFQLSTTADSIATGTWTGYSAFNFLTPYTDTSASARNGNATANRTTITNTISGLSIANGSSFFIRWIDANPSGADDGLAVDDFSLTPQTSNTPTNPSLTVTGTPDTVVRGNSTLLKATVTPGTNPASTGLAVTANLSAIGGSASQTMYDDATHGDVTLGDNIFSYTATVPVDSPAGTKSLSFTVTDGQSRSGNTNHSIVVILVACPTITLSPASLPSGVTGTPYSQTISATGGVTPYSYAVTSGTLPTGLSLGSNGSLTGTPSAGGSFSFTVTATDSNSCTGSKSYSISVTTPASTISLTAISSAYTQNFNTLALSGTSSTVPNGWLFSESGASSNTTYTAGTGSSNTGDTYSFGAASDTDRAFGGLQSSNVIPTVGAGFTNNTGSTVVSLQISYTGEEWRLGALSRKDSLLFQLSTDASNLTTGAWTSYPSLDFTSPNTTGTAGALNGNDAANKTSVSYLITGLSLANGSTFFIRWNDAGISGSDDGLAIDDFSIIPYSSGVSPTNPSVAGNANPSTVAAGNTTVLTATVTPGTNPASTALAVSANLSSVGGSSSQAFYDDGTHGDTIQSDNIFTFTASVPSNTTPGAKSLALTVTDGQSRSGNGTLNLTVTAYVCPTITVSPSSLPGDVEGNNYNQTVTASGGASPYTYSVTSGSLPKGVTLSSNGSLQGTLDSAATYSFTVTATDSNNCTGSKAYSVTVTPAIGSVSVSMDALWNIVSNPLISANDSVKVLYPTSTSSAFAFISSGGYQIKTRLENGVGYWLKFPSAVTVNLQGTAITSDSIDVVTGWNIVGSISEPVVASMISSIPPGIQTGSFFRYQNGYTVADTLFPGKGYWVKATTEGKLILASSGSILASNRIQIVPNNELPPPPPNGNLSFDQSVIPSEFALEQNYPNPFNPVTTFSMRVAEPSLVSLKVFDVLGREVATIANQQLSAGIYTYTWDASGLTSGIYYYRMTAQPSAEGAQTMFSNMKKLLLMK